jgi:hypothetical protein
MSRIRVRYIAGVNLQYVTGDRWLDPRTGEIYDTETGDYQCSQMHLPVPGEPGIWRTASGQSTVCAVDAAISPTPDPKMDAASSQPATGQKFDGDKAEPGLLLSGCHLAVAGVIAVLGFGFRKYKQRNGWKEVPEAGRRYKDALHRHLAAIERGEIYDNEPGGSGLPHIDHVACNAMFLSQMHHEGFGK